MRAVAVAAVLAICLAGCGGGDRPAPAPPEQVLENGPLRGIGEGRVRVPQNAGKPFVFGLPVVINTGDRPAVLERIGADGLPPGLEITETHVNGPERRNSLAYDFSWPSKRPGFRGIRPVRGYSVGRAARGAQLIYVMRADEPGIYAFDGVTVDYRVGSRHYRARIANGLKACILPAGVKRDVDRCPPG